MKISLARLVHLLWYFLFFSPTCLEVNVLRKDIKSEVFCFYFLDATEQANVDAIESKTSEGWLKITYVWWFILITVVLTAVFEHILNVAVFYREASYSAESSPALDEKSPEGTDPGSCADGTSTWQQTPISTKKGQKNKKKSDGVLVILFHLISHH